MNKGIKIALILTLTAGAAVGGYLLYNNKYKNGGKGGALRVPDNESTPEDQNKIPLDKIDFSQLPTNLTLNTNTQGQQVSAIALNIDGRVENPYISMKNDFLKRCAPARHINVGDVPLNKNINQNRTDFY